MIKLKNLIFENTLLPIESYLEYGEIFSYYLTLIGADPSNHSEIQKNKENILKNLDPVALEKIKDVLNLLIKEILKFDGKECYRLMTIKSGINPLILKKIGQHWSTNRENILGWEPYKDPKGAYCLFTSIVDKNYIDWPQTIDHRFFYIHVDNDITGGDEKEIIFIKNSPIYVKWVEYWKSDYPTSNYNKRKLLLVNQNRLT